MKNAVLFIIILIFPQFVAFTQEKHNNIKPGNYYMLTTDTWFSPQEYDFNDYIKNFIVYSEPNLNTVPIGISIEPFIWFKVLEATGIREPQHRNNVYSDTDMRYPLAYWYKIDYKGNIGYALLHYPSFPYEDSYNFCEYRPTLLRPGDYYIMDGPVNIHSAPNLSGQVIGQIKLHEQVQLIENSGNEQLIENILSSWYKIDYQGITGYIWGGSVAHEALVVTVNGVKGFFYYRGNFATSGYENYEARRFIFPKKDIVIYMGNNNISAYNENILFESVVLFHQSETGVSVQFGAVGYPYFLDVYPDGKYRWRVSEVNIY